MGLGGFDVHYEVERLRWREIIMFIAKPTERLVILGPVHSCLRHDKYKEIDKELFGSVCMVLLLQCQRDFLQVPRRIL